jgi:hypothetical protein
MFKNRGIERFAVAVALVTALGLMAPAVSLAAPSMASGTGPDNAVAPSGIWQHLDPGQERWYSFSTAGQSSDNTPSHVLITMYSAPEGSANFNVWSGADLKARAAQDPNNPVKPSGEGTVMTHKNSDGTTTVLYGGAKFWAEGFMAPETKWVQVTPAGDQPTDYLLSIRGDAVAFPATTDAATASMASTTAAATASSTASATNLKTAMAATAGAGPDTALVPNGATMTVQPGGQQWYVINVPGDSNPNANPHVLAHLSQISGSAKFNVWTEERLHEAAIAKPGTTVFPVGEGTVMTHKNSDGSTTTLFNGDLWWLGDGKIRQTYYVVVEPTGSAPATYSLNASSIGY